MTKTFTHEQYEMQLWEKEVEYWPVEQYKGSTTKINHECICGNIWKIEHYRLLRGSKCMVCNNTGTKTDKKYISELPEGYTTLEPYINSRTSILHKHLVCGHEWTVTPTNIQQGTRCPNCSSNVFKGTDKYKSELPQNILLLEEYKGSAIPIRHKHTLCGHEWDASPNNILKGTRCPICCDRGFNPLAGGYLYFVEFTNDGEIYFKVGITNSINLKDRFEKDWDTFNMRELWKKHYPIGQDARNKEKEILQTYNEFKFNTGVLKSGNTETLTVFIGEPND